MTSSDNLSAASSSSKKRFAKMASRGLRRAETSPAATPSASEPLNLGVSGGVSGESGGGSFFPTSLSFESDEQSESEVKAFVFSEFAMCGAIIGRGQFFCTRPNCTIPAHAKPNARATKRTFRIYIPAAGTALKAFCDPNVDSLDLPDELTALLTSRPHKPSKLKLILRQLREDPKSMSVEQIKAMLTTDEEDSFRERVKQVLTPAKSKVPEETLREQAAEAFKSQQSMPDLPAVPEDNLLRGKDLIPIMNRLELLTDSVGDAISITNLNAKELEDVRKSGQTALLAIESSVGSDPGIGGAETGVLSSAWEGITFVSDALTEVASDVDEKVKEVETEMESLKQSTQKPIRNIKKKVDEVSDSVYKLEEALEEQVVRSSGAYAEPLVDHIRGVVLDFIEEWMKDNMDDGDGDEDLTSPSAGVGASSAGSDIDTRAELSALQEEWRQMRAELDHLKSVTSTGSLKFPTDGFEFENEEELYKFLEEADEDCKLPDDLHTLFIDFWALLDQSSTAIDGVNRQATDAQLARNQESSIKAKFSNPIALSRWGGFQRGMPLAFEPPNTPQSPNPVLIPLPGLKEYSTWDNGSDGALGRKQLVKKKGQEILKTLTNDIKVTLKAPVRDLATAFRSLTKSQEQYLYEWIHETFEHESVASSKSEAWSLVAGCIRAIFEDVGDARLIGRSIHGLTGLRKETRLIWAMGLALMKLDEFVAHNFSGHTSCVSVYTQYMNRARTPISTFKKLEQKVNTMNGEVTKVQAAVTKVQATVTSLKNQRGRRNNNRGNDNQAEAADNDSD